ncbi:DUF3574 domain-containing protein [Aneurinibacillus migulanus]|uniref:DUF3574 domain-containing protein n=1 Tax=Aneurinibacillus migulanus TaxID=47500 RepID=A0A0M0H4E6_ANEMI|nr:hypothetical protein [Aneurinibacillus migulanus]KON96985.1 hypothetical protein AF333_17390 [Aneurinibacillus migulanus]MED0896200.1 DUF3574 domain-containing protein [Aneurinibacillus migulanus]SDJ61841.1 hypothetical protein SAMN04487909_12264 [Aneurinibacillus migulanus]
MLKRKKIFYWIIPIMLIALLANAVYAAEQQEASKVKQSSALHGQFYLEDVVKIYVPSTYNVDQPIDNTPYVHKSLRKFSEMFGGATAIDGTGAWLSDDNQLVKEKVTIVYSFVEDLDKKKLNQVVDYAQSLKEEMKQSSVSLEVNGKMYFIE